MKTPTTTLPIPVAPLSFHAPASPSRVPQTPATWGPHTVLRGGLYTPQLAGGCQLCSLCSSCSGGGFCSHVIWAGGLARGGAPGGRSQGRQQEPSKEQSQR